MYIKSQKIIAIALIFGLSLQGCHNSGLKLEHEEVPKSQENDNPATSLNFLSEAQQFIVASPAISTEKIYDNAKEKIYTTSIGAPKHTKRPTPSGVVQKPQAEMKPSSNNTVAKMPSSTVPSSAIAPTYLSGQGHQVHFEKHACTWYAQVRDVWGHVQMLPVLCAPDQSLEKMLEALAVGTPRQHKYCIHVLETDQAPWAPRIIYVGTLGLRGGGNSSSSSSGDFPSSSRDLFGDDNRRNRVSVDLLNVEFGNGNPRVSMGPSLSRTTQNFNDGFRPISSSYRSSLANDNVSRSYTSTTPSFSSSHEPSFLNDNASRNYTGTTPSLSSSRGFLLERNMRRFRTPDFHSSVLRESSLRPTIPASGTDHPLFPTDSGATMPSRNRDTTPYTSSPSAAFSNTSSYSFNTSSSSYPTSPSRYGNYAPSQRTSEYEQHVEDLSRQAYFRWKEQQDLREAQEAEASKLSSLLSVTSLKTPEAAQTSAEAYLERWRSETPKGRAAIQAQGQTLLKSVEALKEAKKGAYREQVLAFETQDVDPSVWKQLLQAQKDTKTQVDELRNLRSELVNTLRPTTEVLEESKIKATFNADNEVAYYSSDEDEQQLSTQERQKRQELCREVATEAGLWIIAPEAKAAQVLSKVGKAVKLGKQVHKGGQVLIKVTESKVGKEATRLVEKAGGKVVEKGITSVVKSAGLPNSGKIRFIPRAVDAQSGKILQKQGGYVDKFGNIWKRGPSRTKGEMFEWDVQLSQVGKQQLGHLAKSGEHINVSFKGAITH